MGKRTILAPLIDFEIPYNAGKQDNRRLHEEVTLLLHPRLIEVEHNGIGTLVGIRNIFHKVWVNGIATV